MKNKISNNNIPDFREKDEYWCNIPREKMRELNNVAKKTGDWLQAAKKIAPDYLDHFANFYRADCQFLWPTNENSIILDAGSMWGGITLPAAQYHKEVYAVDKTIETLEFLDIRAKQMGLQNIHPVAASLKKLPFKDNFFDLIILNGVLEWVAVEDNIVLEKQWGKRGRGLRFKQNKEYHKDPREMQVDVLKEIHRVLKPRGALYLAIENRIGYTYLLGLPDDHMNLPFVCFLPRFLAKAISRLILKCDYRTYVYSIKGYYKLLKESGFNKAYFYGAFDHYINPRYVVPLKTIKKFKKKLFNNRKWQLKLIGKIIPGWLLQHLPPSVIALAWKEPFPVNYEPRIKQLFRQAGLIQGDCPDFTAIKFASRLENDLAVNYLVYTGDKQGLNYFCKISRDKKSVNALESEANNLKLVDAELKESDLLNNIPKLTFFGNIGGITFLTTKYIEAEKSKFNSNSNLNGHNLKKLNKEINLAIEFLAKFQKYTIKKRVKAKNYLQDTIIKQTQKLKEFGFYNEKVGESLNNLMEYIKRLGGAVLPISAQHGDFDFFYNIMFAGDKAVVVDFEHYESEAAPFLDLITLIFNPLLMSKEYSKKNASLSQILNKPRIKEYLKLWFNKYSKLSGLPKDILTIAPALAVLEQKTKNYPARRNPNTFPLFEQKVFEDMLKLRIEL